jgi:hypothetical protein
MPMSGAVPFGAYQTEIYLAGLDGTVPPFTTDAARWRSPRDSGWSRDRSGTSPVGPASGPPYA